MTDTRGKAFIGGLMVLLTLVMLASLGASVQSLSLTSIILQPVSGFSNFGATALTTFAGLTPLLLERSMQARFLIPMAVSLAFGVLFATFITLILVPSLYAIQEDIRGASRRLWRSIRSESTEAASLTTEGTSD